MIVQSTGEDWIDTKISLSTAEPSVGGNVPELETVNVKVREPVVYDHRPRYLLAHTKVNTTYIAKPFDKFIKINIKKTFDFNDQKSTITLTL